MASNICPQDEEDQHAAADTSDRGSGGEDSDPTDSVSTSGGEAENGNNDGTFIVSLCVNEEQKMATEAFFGHQDWDYIGTNNTRGPEQWENHDGYDLEPGYVTAQDKWMDVNLSSPERPVAAPGTSLNKLQEAKLQLFDWKPARVALTFGNPDDEHLKIAEVTCWCLKLCFWWEFWHFVVWQALDIVADLSFRCEHADQYVYLHSQWAVHSTSPCQTA